MSTQPLTWQQYQALPVDQRRRFLRPDEYKALTAEQRVKLGLEPAQQGAPVDFGGKVLPNPNGVRPMADTESPISDTRLPNGVSFNKQNYQGGAQMDASNPAPADVIPPQMQTIGATTTGQPQADWFDANAPKAAPGGDWFEQNNPKQPQQSALQKWATPPTHEEFTQAMKEGGWAPTVYGLKNIWSGIGQAVQGTAGLVKAPETEAEKKVATVAGPGGLAAYRMLHGIAQTGKAATEVPAAIHDINQSADPALVYGEAATNTAGQGGGQALAALATEGAVKGTSAAVNAIKGASPTAAAAKVARAASDIVNPEVTGVISPRLAHAQKLAGKFADILEKRAAANAPPTYPGAPFPEHLQYPGAPFPEHLQYPGAPMPEMPMPEQINPSLVSPARTLPGQIGAERIYGPRPEPAAPIPSRSGLALRGEVSTPEPPAPTPTQAPKAIPKITQAQVGKQVENALGVEQKPPLQPGVPLRNQGRVALPEGFTPADSTALKGYKYNADAQELETVTATGQRYVHGDVTPEQFAKFDAAESKGKAWNDIRQGSSPLVAKYVNGKRVAVKPTGADLTETLQNSLEQARAARAANSAPQVVYRARDIGEEGVPLNNQHAQATSDLNQAVQYAEPGQRSGSAGEVVKIDLSKLKPSDYVVRTHPNGMKWVQFKRPLTESEVSVVKNAGK